ncbi:hypothetical protein ABDJ40_00900 [Roseateles sp. 2.12]|uniref:Uncharacterized protein n=2 Tax=Roseateles flavus TaxID=3149041 RepID=A0ABV0G8E0_9BURK
MNALEVDGELKVGDFPESELLAAAEGIVSSALFGDFVELLLEQWRDLDDHKAAVKAICAGLKRNGNREAFIHAVDALAESELDDFASFAGALDARAGDDGTSLHIRVEAVAGLVRFALREPRWTTYAGAGVLRLLEQDDDWVKAKLCRLTSILHDHLAWDQAVKSLEALTVCSACAAEARQELGFVEMASAFKSDDVASMSVHLAQATAWFDQCAAQADDVPRARMYGTVAGALARSLQADTPNALDVDSLADDAQWVVHYNQPRAGAAWLTPPAEAELEWIPLLSPYDGSSPVDPLTLLASAVQVFEKVRSVQVIIRGRREFRVPRLSGLTERAREIGLARAWLRSGATTHVSADGRARLEALLKPPGEPPGKH